MTVSDSTRAVSENGIFDGITEKFAVDGQVAYGIGLTFEFAVECQLHTSILFVSKE